MLKKKRSRTMPALFTTQSMRPNVSTAACTILAALSGSATLSAAGDGLATTRLDFRYNLVGRAGLTVLPGTHVVDDDPGATGGEGEREVAPDPAPEPVTTTTFPSTMFPTARTPSRPPPALAVV